MIYLKNLGKRRTLKEMPFIILALVIGKKQVIKLLFYMHKAIENSIDYIAILKEPFELHPKHRLTGYHSFFVDRINKDEQVLDIGCGNGAVAFKVVNETGSFVTGIDKDAGSIAKAQSLWKHDHLHFLCDNALNIEQKRYDVVILSNVLEHIEERLSFLKLLAEKVNPSRILIRVPQYDRHWHVILKQELGLNYFLDNTHFIEYNLETFINEINQAGLKLINCEFHFGEIWAEVIPADNMCD